MNRITYVLDRGSYIYVKTEVSEYEVPRGFLASFLRIGRFLQSEGEDGQTRLTVYEENGATELTSEIFKF